MAHVLEYALRGLDDKACKVLQTIAAFRMPAQYDTLVALLVGKHKPCADQRSLDSVLTDLEDRGLLGWDRRANRYDLHPIVRGVLWNGMGDAARRGVYTTLQAHFDALPKVADWRQVNSLDDLMPAIELYNTLIGLERYDDASVAYRDGLDKATLYRLSASRQRAELLAMLFPDGLDHLPRLTTPAAQAYMLNALALAYEYSGQPRRAAPLFRRGITMLTERKADTSLSVGLCNLSEVLRLAGALREAEGAAQGAVIITRRQADRFQETVSLYWLGLALAARGVGKAVAALQRSLRMFVAQSHTQGEGQVTGHLAQCALWLGDPIARMLADRAWELVHSRANARDFIRVARVQGAAALAQSDLAAASERLHEALTRAREENLVQEELPALIALAELQRRQGDPKAARELLDDVWELAERGPYPLFHADAYNELAQIERDAGNAAAAIEAATKAYRLAWCDGEPFAYHWGLVAARKHLKELGTPEPQMPPFDESKYEPMPDVEIDPDDEFHEGKGEGKAGKRKR